MGFSLILRAFFSFPNECQFIECQFFWEFRDTGIYGLVNNSSDTASEFGVKIDLPHLLAGIESSSINYLDTGEWSQYTNLSIGGPFLTILLLIMGASQSSTSPSPSY